DRWDRGLLWSVQPASRDTPGVLTVEPRRPLAGSADVDPPRLIIRLRADGPAWLPSRDGAAAIAVLPPLAPRGIEGREGTITLKLDPSLIAPIAGSALRPDVPQSFRGRPEASVSVRRRRGRFQAQCVAEATLGHDSLRAAYRLSITPFAGAGQEHLIATTAPLSFPSWR